MGNTFVLIFISYKSTDTEQLQVFASNIKYNSDNTIFDLSYKDKEMKTKKVKNINVKLLGKHNALNSAAAFVVCHNLGANINLIKKSLKNFSGVQRRMTKIFEKNNVEIRPLVAGSMIKQPFFKSLGIDICQCIIDIYTTVN